MSRETEYGCENWGNEILRVLAKFNYGEARSRSLITRTDDVDQGVIRSVAQLSTRRHLGLASRIARPSHFDKFIGKASLLHSEEVSERTTTESDV